MACLHLHTFSCHLPHAGVSVGWGFLMAAYYLALAYYALGPDRLAARFVPHLRRMRSGASTAAIAAGSAAGVAVEWVKGINWVSCCCDWLGSAHVVRWWPPCCPRGGLPASPLARLRAAYPKPPAWLHHSATVHSPCCSPPRHCSVSLTGSLSFWRFISRLA